MKFAFFTWLATRALILVAFVLAVPHGALAAFGNWDGAWYGSIVAHGYQYAADGAKYNVAFFPLFPLLSALLVRIGIGWPLAGVIVNNLAFLPAILLLASLVRAATDDRAARWVAVVACVAPPSLFGSVAYSEGLFMLFSVLALWYVRRERYVYAGIAAAFAAMTRPFGIALALAVIVAALVERRSVREILASSIGLLGVAAFPLFCWLRFGDAIAFVHSANAWRHVSGFDPAGWLALARGAIWGNLNDCVSLALIAAVVPCAIASRRLLGLTGVLFLALSTLLVLFAGEPISVGRYLYACVPLLAAVAMACRRFPVVGYLAAGAGLSILFLDAMAFAAFRWVG
ncbi:MAG TPA: mannosyltransferase family protein [Candidatus Dormibacteraeota bacterium]|nr:mannosyltransferase family protein [Candidatus Dormibacteraeota bacterium]